MTNETTGRQLDYEAVTKLSRDLIDWREARKEIAKDAPHVVLGFGYKDLIAYTGGFDVRTKITDRKLQQTLVEAIDQHFLSQCRDLGIIPPEWLTKPPEAPKERTNAYKESASDFANCRTQNGFIEKWFR